MAFATSWPRAGDVEMRERPMARRAHFGDQQILPDPVQAERHQIVHDVVLLRDRGEYLADQFGFFAFGYVAVAEMRRRFAHAAIVPQPTRGRAVRGRSPRLGRSPAVMR